VFLSIAVQRAFEAGRGIPSAWQKAKKVVVVKGKRDEDAPDATKRFEDPKRSALADQIPDRCHIVSLRLDPVIDLGSVGTRASGIS
jgi:hypothetical protein